MSTLQLEPKRKKFAWRRPKISTRPKNCEECKVSARKTKGRLVWFRKRWLCEKCLLEA